MKALAGIVAATALSACSHPLFEHDAVTPYGIVVITNDFNPDLEQMDARYLASMDCLQEHKPEDYFDSFYVQIMSDKPYFECKESPSGKCAGRYYPHSSEIQVVKSLSAFSHELMHHVLETDDHDNASLQACGDDIDSLFNKTETSYKTHITHDAQNNIVYVIY